MDSDTQDTNEELQAQMSEEDSQALQQDFAAEHQTPIHGEGPLSADEFHEKLGDDDMAEDSSDWMEDPEGPTLSDADEDLPQ